MKRKNRDYEWAGLKEQWPEILILAILVVALAFMICLVGREMKAQDEFDAWYSSLTPEEQVAYEEPYTEVYEIVSVDKYVYERTNRYGGVRGTYICYEFYYLDGDGNVQYVQQFCDDFSGEEVVIGETNTYSTNSRTNVETLTLTLETVQKLSVAVD